MGFETQHQHEEHDQKLNVVNSFGISQGTTSFQHYPRDIEKKTSRETIGRYTAVALMNSTHPSILLSEFRNPKPPLRFLNPTPLSPLNGPLPTYLPSRPHILSPHGSIQALPIPSSIVIPISFSSNSVNVLPSLKYTHSPRPVPSFASCPSLNMT